MESELLKSLGQNGPWAVVAGFLIFYVLKGWEKDRATLVVLLTEFKDTLNGLKSAVEHLSNRIEGEGK